MTRNRFRRGLLALLVLAGAVAGSLAATAAAYELVVNGGFESNGGAGSSSFDGWMVASQPGSNGGFKVQTGIHPPLTPFTVPLPPAGSFAAMSDQAGPGGHVLYQDVTIPAGATATLSARLFVLNQTDAFATPASLDLADMPNQQARFDLTDPAAPLQDTGAGVLQNLFRTQVGDPPMVAYVTVAADISAFAGQTIRLRFAETDNRQGLNFGVDLVSIAITGGLPTTTSLVSAPNPSLPGQAVTLTATVATSNSGTVTGSVAFFDGPALIAGCATVAPVANVAVCPTNALAGGAHVLRAEYSGDADYAPSSGTTNHLVNAAPVIAKAFADAQIVVGATTTLSFTIQNPDPGNVQTGLAFTDALPGGMVVAAVPNLVNACGGAATGVAGAGVVSLSGGTLAAGASCTVSVTVQGTTPGNKLNTVQVASTEGGVGNTASATLAVGVPVVLLPPVLELAFDPAAVAVGAPSTLTVKISNPEGNVEALVGVGFTLILPPGLAVANGSAGACGGTWTATAPATIALSGASLAIDGTCQFGVAVTAVAAGTHTATSGPVTSTNAGDGNAASATLVASQAAVNVPTLQTWALLLLALLVGAIALRRQQRPC